MAELIWQHHNFEVNLISLVRILIKNFDRKGYWNSFCPHYYVCTSKVRIFWEGEIFTLFLTVFTVVKSKVKIHKILWPSQNIWTLQTWGNKDAKNDQMKLHDELMLSRDYYKQEEYKAWIDLYTPAFLIQSKERLKTFHLDRECRHSLIDSFTLGSEKTA